MVSGGVRSISMITPGCHSLMNWDTKFGISSNKYGKGGIREEINLMPKKSRDGITYGNTGLFKDEFEETHCRFLVYSNRYCSDNWDTLVA